MLNLLIVNCAEEYKESPDFWKWCLIQWRKARVGPPQQFSWGIDFDYRIATKIAQLPVALGDETEKELFNLKQKHGPIMSKDGRVLY